MEMKEQNKRTQTSSSNQHQGNMVQADEACFTQASLCHSEDFRTRRKQFSGTRPYFCPEYSPDKLGSALPCSTYGVSYDHKKKLLEKAEEVQQVKQLDDWKPAISIFTAVLQKADEKSS